MPSANPARAYRKNVGETTGALLGGTVGALTPIASAFLLGHHFGNALTDQAIGTVPEGHPFEPEAGIPSEVAGTATGAALASGLVPGLASPLAFALPSALAGAAVGTHAGRAAGHAYHDIKSLAQTPRERLQDMLASADPSERPRIRAALKTAVSAAELEGAEHPRNAGNIVRNLGTVAGTLGGLGTAVLGGGITGGLASDAFHDMVNQYQHQSDDALAQSEQARHAADAIKANQTLAPDVRENLAAELSHSAAEAHDTAQSHHNTASRLSTIGGVAGPALGVTSGMALLAAKPLVAPLYSSVARGAVEPVAKGLDALTDPTQATQRWRGIGALTGAGLGALGGAIGAPLLIPESVETGTPTLAHHAHTALGVTGGIAGGMLGGTAGYHAGRLAEDRDEHKTADLTRSLSVLGGGALGGLAGGYALGEGLQAAAPYIGAEHATGLGWNDSTLENAGRIAGGIAGGNLASHAIGRMYDRRKRPMTLENLPAIAAGITPSP